MYITFDTRQFYFLDNRDNEHNDPSITTGVPDMLPKPEFMPSILVRSSDMKVVNGSQILKGYYALSYSWNQSGKIIYNTFRDRHIRVDKGKHKIIFSDDEDKIISPNKKNIIRSWNKIQNKHGDDVLNNTKYVKFEGIIQQICQQFNIKYIWYDQLCINQDDKEEKYQKIPHEYQYFKRLWTLEEAIKSKRQLLVGENTHIWTEDLYSLQELKILCQPFEELSVQEILYHAHKRTSTKDHDRVLALIHLFPDIIDLIKIDYDQPLKDLMIQFYGLLAKKDLNILLF
ncbi:hypothetical protein BDA99DRAFT_554610 [Phascolomyces articulosus]|uniref:Heterokaryon incompatibility domain-containing protein n=1 Tax=Phascolomyces articulosus TaxID=60185 RepID=A0AAD5PKZ0_9FUNG|nr:hypothetical protein BDA99DRAFT_554610 [Phascolomyces articulosus]